MVLVPFRNRLALAYVIDFPERSDVSSLKPIARVLDEPPVFDFKTLRLCRWISERYICTLSQALRLVVPPGRSRKVKQYVTLSIPLKQAKEIIGDSGLTSGILDVLDAAGGELDMQKLKEHVGVKQVRVAISTLEDKGIVKIRFVLTEPKASPKLNLIVRIKKDAGGNYAGLTEKQKEVVTTLYSLGGIAFMRDLSREAKANRSTLKSLEKKGIIEITSEEILREPRLRGGFEEEIPTPNSYQEKAISEIVKAVEEGKTDVFLLKGVTGSGKTEVYLRSIEKIISMGRSAIVLVPEISLTPQTLERFETRFPGDVAVLHSRLSPGERYDQWRGIANGKYRVVVGARSAIFAPVQNLGLIIIDEEHESSYKSETVPRYHTREVARAKAKLAGAVLVLGSATPSFESIEQTKARIFRMLVLPGRVDSRPMPDIEIIDMREVGGAGQVPLISPKLLDALNRVVSAGEQAILFLNRRGFANFLQCRACGNILSCDSCDVSLCYHAKGNFLLCHHCGSSREVPEVCPSCGKKLLKQYGAGTQRVEEEVIRNLPGVSMIRMDTDTTQTKDSHWKMLGAFRRKEAQILIGTQMIAKGLDIPGVTLVGVINADTALALPDFRASERTYQLLTQVSGRAGRGLRPGKVIIQTFNPEHPAIQALLGEEEIFIESELSSRRKTLYPPFVELVNILVSSADMRAASRSASRLKKILERELGKGTTILGPAPAPLSRLRGMYRWHIILKCPDTRIISSTLRHATRKLYDYSREFPVQSEIKVSLDVDPVTLL